MIEFRVLIPVADNDGHLFSPEHHLAFEAEMLRRFGGFSLLPGTVRGTWLSEGRTYADDLRTYVVAVSSVFEAGSIREVAQFALDHYRQEALYVAYLGSSEIVTRA